MAFWSKLSNFGLTNTSNDYGNTLISEGGILSISSDDNIGHGTNTIEGGTLQLDDATYNLDWILTGETTNKIKVDADGAIFEGELDGDGGFTKTGKGTLTLSETTKNYNGDTIIDDGTLKGLIPEGTNLAINNNGTYDGNNNVISIGTLYGEENAKIINTTSLTVDGGGTFDGIIDSSNGKLIVTNTDPHGNILILTNTNNYGDTLITDGGILSISSDANIGSGTNTLDGGTLILTNGDTPYNKAWILDGSGSDYNHIKIDAGLSVEISGILSEATTGNGFTKTGDGTLILTAENTYTGDTHVKEGDLEIGNGGTTGNIISNLILDQDTSVTFNRYNDINYDNKISGQGDLIKDGAGTLNLTNENSYTGKTIVEEGTLAIGTNGSISDSKDLELRDHTTFKDGGNTPYSLDEGTLTLVGTGITYDGNLEAEHSNIIFTIPSNIGEGSTVLTVTGDADIDYSLISIGISGNGQSRTIGEDINLFNVTGTFSATDLTKGNASQGVSLNYDFDYVIENGKMAARIKSKTLDPKTKSLSEGYLGGLGLITIGADLIAGPGLDSAIASARNGTGWSDPAGQSHFNTFSAFSGGKSRYNTGSHVDLENFSLMGGASIGNSLDLGQIIFGAFFEYGLGQYDTYNSFINQPDVFGEGKLRYMGGGILSRLDLEDYGPGHFHVEASGRAGQMRNEYNSSNLVDSSGRKASFTTKAPYFGAHGGLGYIWDINDALALDIFGQYFWTRQKGDSLTLSTGDPLEFEDMDSQRTKTGARLSYGLTENIRPYIGAAIEREFNGQSKATAYKMPIDSPSLKGNTGVGDLGLSWKAGSLPLTTELGVVGYTGKREGISGKLELKIEF